MSSFDFITAPEFRQSLESDYSEMLECVKAHAWKSAQVMAGSIVEALLIDYLIAKGTGQGTAKDPLKMDLAEAIPVCKADKALSDRSADLSSVVRSYRNLIHPGRMVRLLEEPPNESSANIAVAL